MNIDNINKKKEKKFESILKISDYDFRSRTKFGNFDTRNFSEYSDKNVMNLISPQEIDDYMAILLVIYKRRGVTLSPQRLTQLKHMRRVIKNRNYAQTSRGRKYELVKRAESLEKENVLLKNKVMQMQRVIDMFVKPISFQRTMISEQEDNDDDDESDEDESDDNDDDTSSDTSPPPQQSPPPSFVTFELLPPPPPSLQNSEENNNNIMEFEYKSFIPCLE